MCTNGSTPGASEFRLQPIKGVRQKLCDGFSSPDLLPPGLQCDPHRADGDHGHDPERVTAFGLPVDLAQRVEKQQFLFPVIGLLSRKQRFAGSHKSVNSHHLLGGVDGDALHHDVPHCIEWWYVGRRLQQLSHQIYRIGLLPEQDDVVFGLEVRKEGAARNTGLCRDGVQRCAFITVRQEQALSDFCNALLRFAAFAFPQAFSGWNICAEKDVWHIGSVLSSLHFAHPHRHVNHRFWRLDLP
jgi:hypothetical protein